MNWLPELSPYLVLIAAGFLPNEVWRMLGIVVAHGLDGGSELVVWVRAVATGLLRIRGEPHRNLPRFQIKSDLSSLL